MKLAVPPSKASRAVSSVEVDIEGSAADELASWIISPSARSVAAGSSAIVCASSGSTIEVPADSSIALSQTTSPS